MWVGTTTVYRKGLTDTFRSYSLQFLILTSRSFLFNSLIFKQSCPIIFNRMYTLLWLHFKNNAFQFSSHLGFETTHSLVLAVWSWGEILAYGIHKDGCLCAQACNDMYHQIPENTRCCKPISAFSVLSILVQIAVYSNLLPILSDGIIAITSSHNENDLNSLRMAS